MSIRSFTFTPADGVPPSVAPFAHATAAGPTLYVTGQMPTDTTGALVGHDIASQTDQVMGNLLRVTELCGGSIDDVVQVRAYLLEWKHYAVFNETYARWFPQRLPSRTCIGTTGLAAGALVELDWVAWRENGWGQPLQAYKTLDPDVAELVDRVMRERRLSFKEAVNQAIRDGVRPPGAAVPIRTLSLGGPKPGIDLHHANRPSADIEDDELARKLETRK